MKKAIVKAWELSEELRQTGFTSTEAEAVFVDVVKKTLVKASDKMLNCDAVKTAYRLLKQESSLAPSEITDLLIEAGLVTDTRSDEYFVYYGRNRRPIPQVFSKHDAEVKEGIAFTIDNRYFLVCGDVIFKLDECDTTWKKFLDIENYLTIPSQVARRINEIARVKY